MADADELASLMGARLNGIFAGRYLRDLEYARMDDRTATKEAARRSRKRDPNCAKKRSGAANAAPRQEVVNVLATGVGPGPENTRSTGRCRLMACKLQTARGLIGQAAHIQRPGRTSAPPAGAARPPAQGRREGLLDGALHFTAGRAGVHPHRTAYAASNHQPPAQPRAAYRRNRTHRHLQRNAGQE